MYLQHDRKIKLGIHGSVARFLHRRQSLPSYMLFKDSHQLTHATLSARNEPEHSPEVLNLVLGEQFFELCAENLAVIAE